MIHFIGFLTTYLLYSSFTATLINEFDSRKTGQSIEIDVAFFIYNSHIQSKSVYGATKESLPTIPEYGSSQKINLLNSNIYNPHSVFYLPTSSIIKITAYVQYRYFDEISQHYALLSDEIVPTSADQLNFVFRLVNDAKAYHGLRLIQ